MAEPANPLISIPAEVDESSETDSAYGDDQQSVTTSLSSSVFDYKYQNGRRYNNYRAGTYWYGYSIFVFTNFEALSYSKIHSS